MKLPLSWLSDYTDITGITPKEYDAKLTMSGSKVEEVYYLGAEIENVVTGKILSVVDHPDSDHLKICQLDVGKEEPVQIVTGAPNVTPASVGEICPVCLHKSTLPGGVKITKGKLRGVPSNGMMCSFQELGLSHGCVPYACENGILFLPAGTPVGEDIKKVLGLDDWVSDFEITSNRPDCLSVIGLARETAATFDRPFSVKTRLTARLQQMAHPEETLNVGIGLMHGAAWMPSLLPLFHEIYPSVSINLIEQGDELLMQSLRSNDADLVVGGMTPGSQETSVDLALEQLLLIVPRSFNLVPPWAYSGNSAENPYEITPKQLQNLPLILPSAANDIGGITQQALEHFDISPQSVTTVSSMQTAAMLVSQNMGYLFTSPVFLGMQMEYLASKIVYCTMKGMPDTRKIVAVYQRDSCKKEMVERFIELLHTVVLPEKPGLFLLSE